MSTFLRKLYCFAISIGYARAASVLAQHGKYQEARNIMLSKDKECC